MDVGGGGGGGDRRWEIGIESLVVTMFKQAKQAQGINRSALYSLLPVDEKQIP